MVQSSGIIDVELIAIYYYEEYKYGGVLLQRYEALA